MISVKDGMMIVVCVAVDAMHVCVFVHSDADDGDDDVWMIWMSFGEI